tara:strand:- start:268 stop:483 length:216 start_codon:yes stop_codon:yes gene_type:complete
MLAPLSLSLSLSLSLKSAPIGGGSPNATTSETQSRRMSTASDAVKRRAICVKKTIQKKTKKTQKIKTKQAS